MLRAVFVYLITRNDNDTANYAGSISIFDRCYSRG